MRHRDEGITWPDAEKPGRRRLVGKKYLPALLLVAVVLAGGGLYVKYGRPGPADRTASTTIQPAGKLVSIPVYYPRNLPAGYSYNGNARALKSDILYFSVTGPGQQVFHITQQPIPPSFDFTAFDKKFLNPATFNSDAGSAIAGQAGANLIGSVQTNKNTWIIINSVASNSPTELEVVIRSLELTH